VFTYDASTQPGKVRLLAIDTIEAYAQFQDDEVQAFLDLSSGVVLLAAAQALDTLAANAALVQGRTRFAGVSLDGQVVAEALHTQAMELRRQYHEGDDGGSTSPIDWAEMVVDQFSYRDRLVNEMLRQST
jgi:hypothetical protein